MIGLVESPAHCHADHIATLHQIPEVRGFLSCFWTACGAPSTIYAFGRDNGVAYLCRTHADELVSRVIDGAFSWKKGKP